MLSVRPFHSDILSSLLPLPCDSQGDTPETPGFLGRQASRRDQAVPIVREPGLETGASPVVGTSGKASERVADVTASLLIAPERMCGNVRTVPS
jgi:hypothetical protein